MPSLRTIWRIDMTATTAIDHAQLAAGLRLHVAHSPLTTVAMQIGTQQQCYVVLDGCPGCLTDQCRIGCRAALFRRLFATCMVDVGLCAVAPPQGLARRPYLGTNMSVMNGDNMPKALFGFEVIDFDLPSSGLPLDSRPG